MTDPTANIPDRADEDRVVSRRVHNPTKATESDERAYEAATDGGDDRADTGGSPGRDTGGAASGIGAGGEASEGVRADRDLRQENESEPTRSE